MKNILRFAAVSLIIFIACRDRDFLLGPDQGSGALLVSVRFAEDSLRFADIQNQSPEKSKKFSGVTALSQSSTITSIQALVFDESAAARTLLARGDLAIDRSNSTFSGTLEVPAGDSRIVAVQAHTGSGISWLGVSGKIAVPRGGKAEASVELRNYVPQITEYEAVSQTGDFLLRWGNIPNAAGYIVYESAKEDFTSYDSVLVTGQTTASYTSKPRGLHYFRLRAFSDYAFGALGDPVSVRVTSAPQVEILSPSNGGSVAQGERVLFLARAFDQEEGNLAGGSITWTSSRDGVFAAGNLVLYDRLSLGIHLITMTARNNFGASASDTVAFIITTGGNRAPQVSITNPGNGSSANRGQTVLFLAQGSDPEEGQLAEDRFYWLSGRDGFFGSGGSLAYSGLSLGAHTIRVVGRDFQGAAGVDSIALSILGSGANTAPVVKIVTPLKDAVFAPGTLILLQGEAQDAEEGLLGPEALAWSSSRDGSLGSGAAKVVSSLSPGEHTIYLTASDRFGAAGRDSVKISISASGSNRPPNAAISLPLKGSKFPLGAGVRFAGGGSDPETGLLESTESLLWFTVSLGILGRGPILDYAGLPLGAHTIYLAAIDPQGAAGLDSVAIEIVSQGGNRVPQVTITAPPPGSIFNSGALIYLAALAFDPEDGRLSGRSVSWSSSLDGFLGYGEELFTSGLSIGSHKIKASAVDSHGGVGTDSVALQVTSSGGAAAPTVRILSPKQGSVFSAGSGILFSAEAVGITEEKAREGSVWWASSKAGRIGTGLFFVENGLPLGIQKIYLTAVSDAGTAARDSVEIEVASSGNRSPIVKVFSPATKSNFASGQTIIFFGRADDPEDGPLAGEALNWISSAAGKFGSGDYFTSTSLPTGGQWIFLVAVDRAGAAGKDSVQILVGAGSGNQPPVADIVHPVDGRSFATGTAVLLSGSATDAEEGNLPPESLSWYSSRDGSLGTGDYLLAGGLTEGEHRIRLLARDREGLVGSSEVTIRMVAGGNRPPVVQITAPPDGSAFVFGRTVNFEGTASDPEEGVLGGTSLSWISNLDGPLGNGAVISTDRLSSGRHRVVLLALDSQGAGALDSILVSVSRPPQVEITSPSDGTTYPVGTPIGFSGSARDPEEGILPGSALSWWSSLTGQQIGTGASFTINNLGLGTHRITLIAVDRLGIKDSAAVTITVFAVPDSLIASIPTGAGPFHIVLDRAGHKAYVSNSYGNSISIIDLESLTSEGTVAVGANPAGLAYSPALGRIYVANSSGNSVSVIRNGSMEQTITVDFQPTGVAVNPQESQVYVSNSNSASISVISSAEGRVTRTLANAGNSPGEMLIPSGGSRLFVSNYGSRDHGDTEPDDVSAIDLETDLIISIREGIEDKPMGLASTSDGRLVFVANFGSSSVSIISAATLHVENRLSVGQGTTACAVTPDDNQLYVVNSRSRSLSVFNIQSKSLIETISDFGTEPYDIAIYQAADGRLLALVTDRGANLLRVLLVR